MKQKIKKYFQDLLGITDIVESARVTDTMLNYVLIVTIENQHKIFDIMNPVVKVSSKKINNKSKKK